MVAASGLRRGCGGEVSHRRRERRSAVDRELRNRHIVRRSLRTESHDYGFEGAPLHRRPHRHALFSAPPRHRSGRALPPPQLRFLRLRPRRSVRHHHVRLVRYLGQPHRRADPAAMVAGTPPVPVRRPGLELCLRPQPARPPDTTLLSGGRNRHHRDALAVCRTDPQHGRRNHKGDRLQPGFGALPSEAGNPLLALAGAGDRRAPVRLRRQRGHIPARVRVRPVAPTAAARTPRRAPGSASPTPHGPPASAVRPSSRFPS